MRLRLRTRAGRLRRDFSHMLVRRRDAPGMFGVVGNPRVRYQYARLYLGSRDHLQVSYGLHRHCDGFVERCLRQHGMVVLSETAIPETVSLHALRVPNFVSLIVEVRDFPNGFLKGLPGSGNKDARRIRSRGFGHQVLKDPDWALEFHTRYHAPSIAGRHGEEGFVMPAHEIAREITEGGGEFLQIHQDGRCVAALLGHVTPEGYRMARIGWLDADDEIARSGAISAVYWASFARAAELGLSHVRMGGTPPFFECGVMQFKAKWGAEFSRADTWWGDHHLALDPRHPDCRRFLETNPVIIYGDGDRFAVVSGRRPAETKCASSLMRGLSHWFCLRDTPAEGGQEHELLPVELRKWFDSIALP